VWSPKGTRLSISSFVAILGRRHLSTRSVYRDRIIQERFVAFLQRWLCVLNRRKPVEYAEILDSSGPTIGVFPLIMSATYPATRSAGNTV
jgi:hypothetical protein